MNQKSKLAFSLIELSVVILIIGILVLGVTQGSRMMYEAKLKSATSLTQSSPVISMENLVLWLEPTNASTIAVGSVGSGVYGNAADGSLVAGWKDRNPQRNNGYIVSPDIDANRPIYVKNGINGLPTLSFDGAKTFLSNTSGVIPAGKKDYTIVAVWQSNSIANSQQTIFAQVPLSCSGNRAGIYLYGAFVSNWACNAGYDYTTTFKHKIKTPYILISRVNKNADIKVTLYLNEQLQPGSPTNTTNLDSGTTLIGSAGSGGYFNGYISEIIVFDRALDDYEITAIQKYLSSKYRISLS